MTKEEDHLNRESNFELQSETFEMSRDQTVPEKERKGRKGSKDVIITIVRRPQSYVWQARNAVILGQISSTGSNRLRFIVRDRFENRRPREG
jgi:hypothetical protein